MERPGEEGEESPPGLEAMWGMETGADCDCPGPPPEFLLPPPPRPPFLQSADPSFCSEDTISIETCDALPVSTLPSIFHIRKTLCCKPIFINEGNYHILYEYSKAGY